MAAAFGYLLLRLVLSVAASAHPFSGAPQTAARGPQGSVTAPSDNAAISGTVRDQSGTALRGARVILTDERSSAQRVVLTSESGAYTFTPVDAGTYALTAELSGFVSAVRPHLTVESHGHLNVELSLAPKPARSEGQPGEAANGGAIAAGSPQSNLDSKSNVQNPKSPEPPAPERREADSNPLLGQRTADPKAGSALRFDYDDKPNYKPGDIASSSEPGGYSSGANADSYDLILTYVQGEPIGEPSEAEEAEKGTGSGGATRPRALEQGRHSEIDEAALQSWNENQFFSRGSDLLLHREFAPASDLFQRGAARFPDSAKLQTGLGVALYARGLYDQAVTVLLRAADMVPSDPRPYLLLARAYSVSHRQNDEVVKHLERLVEIDPKSAPARCYYALSLWRNAGEKPNARAGQIERLLKDAVALDPQFVDAHLELGALYAEQAKYSDAIPEYRRAIAINPDLAAAHYRLAQVYARTGDRAAAETELGLYVHLREARSKK